MPARMRRIAGATACIAVLWSIDGVAATAGYPSRPIRVVVPFSPGGGSDILARLLSPRMAERLGQPVVVENRPAGTGIVGTDIVAKAAPDGHTLLLVQAAHAVNAQLFTRLPYDPIRDFTPITLVVSSPSGFFLHPAVPTKTVREFIAHAKANPDKLNFGSAGSGSTPHLGMELFSSMAGIKVNHVPYKGAGQVITALLGNEIQLTFTNLVTTRPHWQAGRLRFIAHAGSKRLEAMPEIPTISESGLPGYEMIAWWGYMAPARTPLPVVSRLHSDIVAAANLPDVRQTYVAQGSEVVANTPEEFSKMIRSEAEKWGAIGKRLGIKLD